MKDCQNKPYCYTCDEEGHSAGTMACKKYKELIQEKRKENRNLARPNRTTLARNRKRVNSTPDSSEDETAEDLPDETQRKKNNEDRRESFEKLITDNEN